MILRLRIGKWRFTYTMAPVTNVIGVNSKLPNGNHMLMWDFDEEELMWVLRCLHAIQKQYNLPAIYVLETKKPQINPCGNYIAYCFKQCSWRKAVEIIASTPNVCWNFFKFGIYRGVFTLRVSPKVNRKPKLIYTLPSKVPEDCSIKDLQSWVEYETIANKQFAKYYSLEIDKKGVEWKRPSTLKRQ